MKNIFTSTLDVCHFYMYSKNSLGKLGETNSLTINYILYYFTKYEIFIYSIEEFCLHFPNVCFPKDSCSASSRLRFLPFEAINELGQPTMI